LKNKEKEGNKKEKVKKVCKKSKKRKALIIKESRNQHYVECQKKVKKMC